MTGASKRWVLVTLCTAMLLGLVGCGSDGSAPVYDTAGNPHGFPQAACELIDAIEAGQLSTYDIITDAFGRLYLEHQELLENRHWQEIIKRLGAKFHHKADSLATGGLKHYSQAAGYYILAAFANPADGALSEKARLFGAWKNTVEGLDAGHLADPHSDYLPDRLDFLRHFVLGDSIEATFARQFLTQQLLDDTMRTATVTALKPADRALLNYLDYGEPFEGEPVATWDEPALRLVTYRFTTLGSERCRGEFYFIAGEQPADDVLVEVTLDVVDTTGASDITEVSAIFGIDSGVDGWEVGRIGVAHNVFPIGRPQGEYRLALRPSASDSSEDAATHRVTKSIRLPVLMQ